MRTNGWNLPQKRGKFVSIFIGFFILSITFLILFQTTFGNGLSSFIDSLIRPFQRSTYALSTRSQDPETELEQLRSENQQLRVALSNQQELEREIQALQDQFNTPTLRTSNLIPATIVGIKSFIPGFSIPSEIIISVGSQQGAKPGQVVVSKDILIGKIVQVSPNASKVDLTTKEGFSLTAKAAKTNALGIIKGQGSGMMLLDNVVLSDSLTKNDLVLTKGSVDERGLGSPPDLVIGKIISVNKKASELFQSAEVVPLVDVTKVSTVFILDQS